MLILLRYLAKQNEVLMKCKECTCFKIAQLKDVCEKFGVANDKAIALRNKAREKYGIKDVTIRQIIKANKLEE